ncbi:ATP-dependent DNA helicase RecG [Nesterenkonia sphaerica]|uniref:ATP-dependent DNA helicase RecG n=1 Tax=Nesterenkonia sphaerica TaxID=1804988 RepID=A0A5R9AB36_9MICC|nr:ATP-dependent DNA helicase RecG [Nesterenkonia sphaerica]TLP75324.1 ATP-dependent DNA helicase RecG [Nesterenkonia sphaerica]
MTSILPDTPVDRLLGKAAQRLATGFEIRTVRQLLDHFPRRYIQASSLSDFSELSEGEYVTFIALVTGTQRRSLQGRKRFIVEVTVEDGQGSRLRMAYFNGYRALKDLSPGVRALFHGKVTTFNSQLTLNNPDYAVHSDTVEGAAELVVAQALSGGPMALYPANRHIASWDIQRAVAAVLQLVDFSTWPDPVPPHIAGAENLPDLGTAYRLVHQPQEEGAHTSGIRRFRFQEALLMQGVLERRRQETALWDATAMPLRSDGMLAAFDAQLPFELTSGQQHSGTLIARDLARSSPMNRLLQGEVGSGKTLVALRAMLQAADAGAQSVLVAPTEVLAAQHSRSLRRALGPMGESAPAVTVLTGSLRTSERKKALLDIASGRSDIIIATHSVFSGAVSFAQLGLVVIDEQHRFGVEQRSALRERFAPTPHMLVMSATPIPRSVAMTVFGDLELTVLEGLPGGRSPIQTHVVPTMRGPAWIQRVWERVAEQVQAGRQVYIVCPKITAKAPTDEEVERQLEYRFGLLPGQQHTTLAGQTEDGAAHGATITREWAEAFVSQDASVELIADRLAGNELLSEARLGTLHGQLPAEEAAEIMSRFESGEIDVLVATTVVEVGVDVPNATAMVILDAESFGISTLHQLRGRIGRGSTTTNLCLLVTRMPESHPSVERLRQVAQHRDGMALARLDLARRREGDVLGASQSGRSSSLQHLSILRDEDLISAAAKHIARLSAEDPFWEGAPELARAVTRWEREHDDAVDYVNQG